MRSNLFKTCIMALGLIQGSVFSQSFNCGDSLLDTRDGKKYATVQIGSACWMKQNLNYGTTVQSFSSGTIHSDQFNNSIPEKYAPDGDNSKLASHGGLYEWDELMNYNLVEGSQGLCPNGWHVPSDAEWQAMIAAAGATLVNTTQGNGGNKLKATNEGFGAGIGTNTSGFTARSAGDRDAYGIFYGLGYRFIFWTSTINTNKPWHYTLWAEKDTVERLGQAHNENGFSCRCVKNLGTGLNEKTEIDQFNMYPNPAKEKLVLSMNYSFKTAHYKMVNIIGETIAESDVIGKTEVIPLSIIPRGIYFITVIADGKKTEKKLIIAK